MRLAISNIAWSPSEDIEVAELLRHHNVDAIDVAPGGYFSDPAAAKDFEIAAVRDWWGAKGIEITGMQALLFGKPSLNVFGAPDVRAAMLLHLRDICRIGSGLGARRLVFGSPKNRDRTGLGEEAALDIAVPFFQRLGAIAEDHGVVVCLEPNPPQYGANFMITTAEAAEMVMRVAHPAIRLQFDTGALALNCEDPDLVLTRYASLVGHVHLSEPGLVPLGDSGTNHTSIANAIFRHLDDPLTTIEMLASKDESHLGAIQRALDVATCFYRNCCVRGDA